MAKIILLTIPHGASHRRAAYALQKALVTAEPQAEVAVIDALAHCTAWFRAYYNSYEIPLRFFPALWGWIESIQHQSESTGPDWLYRRGARPLFDLLARERPDAVIATEVGMGELAALAKKTRGLKFRLIGVELTDFNLAWIQPEFDLYLTSHADLAAELVAAGAPSSTISNTGHPIDLAFTGPLDRAGARVRLGLGLKNPIILVMFGGTGFGNPEAVIGELKKIRATCEVIFVAGHNSRFESHLKRLSAGLRASRVLGWVDNIHEYMSASDVLVSKAGGSTFFEAAACELPMLAIHPLPGNEERTCAWIEKWQAGIWIRDSRDLASTIEDLLSHPDKLLRLRERARSLARPWAAQDGAQAVLDLIQS